MDPRAPRTTSAVALALFLGGCGQCGHTESTKAGASDGSGSEPTSSASAASARPTTSEPSDGGASSSTTLDGALQEDAGPSACRLAYGPAEQAFRGPAAIVVSASELRLVANDTGKPRIFSVPITAPPPATAVAAVPPKPASFVAMRSTPCEIAGKWAYCPANGSVYRTTLGTTDTKVVAKNQPGTRISAAPLGADHAVVATLDARRTTEGVMMQAFVTLDDGETVRLSEDGAGATVVRLVPRGESAVALYIDARMAMVPIHARPMSLKKTELALADDAVVHVGGPPERGIDFTAAAAGKSFFALVPMARETTDFGMAVIPIAEHPKEDVQPIWSPYPNGLDPAPIAATVPSSGEAGDAGRAVGWVARVRPAERAVGAPRILELGRLDAAGAFTSLGAISTGKRITDLAIATDAYGAVWIVYGDPSATWLERRVCPP